MTAAELAEVRARDEAWKPTGRRANAARAAHDRRMLLRELRFRMDQRAPTSEFAELEAVIRKKMAKPGALGIEDAIGMLPSIAALLNEIERLRRLLETP